MSYEIRKLFSSAFLYFVRVLLDFQAGNLRLNHVGKMGSCVTSLLMRQSCDYPSASVMIMKKSRWRHHMETFSALLALCAGNSPVTGEFPSQRPVTWSFDVFFDLCLNKRFSKQSGGWWFETPSRSLYHNDQETDQYQTATIVTFLQTCMQYLKDSNISDLNNGSWVACLTAFLALA